METLKEFVVDTLIVVLTWLAMTASDIAVTKGLSCGSPAVQEAAQP